MGELEDVILNSRLNCVHWRDSKAGMRGGYLSPGTFINKQALKVV